MKKMISYWSLLFLLIIGTATFSSCKDDENNTDAFATPQLVSTFPESGSELLSTAAKEITLKFDNFIYMDESKKDQITVSPEVTVEDIGILGKELILRLSPLASNTEYTVTVPTGVLKDRYDNVLDKVELKFKTMNITVEVEPNQSGMRSDALELMKNVSVGWNLGNSLEAFNEDDQINHGADTETAWGNPATTAEMITVIKNAGFNAVRIPVRWYPHAVNEELTEFNQEWITRVKAVVDICLNDGMYVILNTHHEKWETVTKGGESEETMNSNLSKFANLWKFIATTFRDYDERLVFSGTNEMHNAEWDSSDAELQMQNQFNECFVNVVRSTGGKNFYRNLIVQAYSCFPDNALTDKFILPKDVVENRLSVEFHFYRPSAFAYMDCPGYESNTFHYWGKDYKANNNPAVNYTEDEAYVDDLFGKLKAKFVDNGCGVVMGEYGVVTTPSTKGSKVENDLAETKKYYMNYLTSSARRNGIAPFVWDNGSYYNLEWDDFFNVDYGYKADAEYFGLFNRYDSMNSGACQTPVLEGVMTGTAMDYPY